MTWREEPRDWIWIGDHRPIAEEIRVQMIRRKIHHQAAADIIGVKRQAFERRLHGKTNWRYSELRKLAIAWGMLPLDLVGDVPDIRTNVTRE